MRIQFLRFTTGESHDLASNWTFELDLKCKSPSDCELGMEVMGSCLVMIVTQKTRARLPGRHQRIYVVDWTRGYTHCVRFSCRTSDRCSPRQLKTGPTSLRRNLLSHSYLCFKGRDSPCAQTRLFPGSLPYHGGKRQPFVYPPNCLHTQVAIHASARPGAPSAAQ